MRVFAVSVRLRLRLRTRVTVYGCRSGRAQLRENKVRGVVADACLIHKTAAP